MDVRIGTIDATIVDTGTTASDGALVERIVKRVLAALEARKRHEERAKKDSSIAAPDDDDIEGYG